MSEHEHNLPASDDPEWVGLVLDVENRFEALNDALSDLRSAVIRLSSYRPQPQVIHEYVAEPQEMVESKAALEDAVRAFEAAAEVPEPPETEAETEPEAAPVAVESNGAAAAAEEMPEAAASDEDDEARREEVARMVAEARQKHLTPSGFDGSWANAHDDSEVDSTSEGSWPMARPPAPADALPPAVKDHSPALMDEIGLEVEGSTQVDAEEQARREEVARMVAEMKAGLTEEPEARETEEESAGNEPAAESRREEVARMVAEMRAKISPDDEGEAAEPESEEDLEAQREDVAGMVAQMRAEMTPDDSTEGEARAGSEAPADDVDVRDEVRKAVEAARAEMASGWVKEGAAAEADAGDKKFSFPDWQNAHMEPSGPPVIVIKDTEGRVELARVYETLSAVNCDENAALLNYTPHSVTVGLNMRATVPSKEAMEKAIEAVFGRSCRVESDGVRVSVDIGLDKENVA